jgi:hypothetical protein
VDYTERILLMLSTPFTETATSAEFDLSKFLS